MVVAKEVATIFRTMVVKAAASAPTREVVTTSIDVLSLGQVDGEMPKKLKIWPPRYLCKTTSHKRMC